MSMRFFRKFKALLGAMLRLLMAVTFAQTHPWPSDPPDSPGPTGGGWVVLPEDGPFQMTGGIPLGPSSTATNGVVAESPPTWINPPG